MVSDHRESYTPDGVDRMKWGLTREAIGKDIQQAAFDHEWPVCFRGNLDEGYRISYDHDARVHDQEYEPDHGELPSSVTHYCLPPVVAAHGDGTVYLEDYRGNRKPTAYDVWSDQGSADAFALQGYYRTWQKRVDQVFFGWDKVDQIPEERLFWTAAEQIRDAVKPLGSMALVGGSYYLGCHHLGLVQNDPGMADSPTSQERMWAPQINGPIDRFVIPLQGTLLNLLVLGELLAAQLEGMGNMWQNARSSVMDLGWHGTALMSGDKSVDAETVLKTAGWVVGAMGLIALPEAVAIGVGAAGLVIAGAQEVLGSIKDNQPVDRTAQIEHGTAQEVLDSITSLLDVDETCGLEPQVQKDESSAEDILRVAQSHLEQDKTVYDPASHTYRTTFTLEVDHIRDDDNPDRPPNVDIDVDFQRLRGAGTAFADELAAELRTMAADVREVFPTNSGWTRPEQGNKAIGTGPDGPWPFWNAVRIDLADILDRTATQVEDVGEYLVATANFLERGDATAKAAFDQTSQQLDGVF
jgi:hypothetical protein